MDRTESHDPATGKRTGYSPLAMEDDVRKAIEQARLAQPAWAATPVRHRSRILLRLRENIVSRADELAEIISRDTGKTRVDALLTEVLPTALAVGYYACRASKWLKSRRLLPGNLLLANKSCKIVHVPYGVIGVISPWNYPFSIPFSEVVMALLAGNAVLLKTATQTQMAGRALEACIKAAGLPDGLFTYLNLPGKLAGESFLRHGVDKLFFTGSTAVGKQLMAKAAETLTPVCLELGGNDAMLVCPDADLVRAAGGAAWAGFQNAGQTCGGVERICVHRNVYEPFLELLAERVRSLRVGADTDFNLDMGAMTTTRQMETVSLHIRDALEKGAEVYASSLAPNESAGNFLPAVVLTKVHHGMLVMQEETFGPVVGVMKVTDMNEAVFLANDSSLGLTGSVWSRNRGLAENLGRRIKAGVVTFNDHLMSHGLAESPWGGFKESGIGRTHGEIGFTEMTQVQCLVDDYLPWVRKDMWWYPHGPEVYRGLLGMLTGLYGHGLTPRLKGWADMLKLFRRTFRP